MVASIATLVQITYDVACCSQKYFSALKTAKSTQNAYQNEVEALTAVLHKLERDVKSSIAESGTGDLSSLLSNCQRDLKSIRSDLSKISGPFSRIMWPLKEKQLIEHIGKIHRHNNIIQSFISSSILAATTSIQSEIGLLKISQTKSQFLAAISPRNPISKPRPHSCPGTGAWFLESSNYADWLGRSPDTSGMLWCHGLPGVGKSVLASLAVDDLQRRQRRDGFYLAHFFCDDYLRSHQTTPAIMQTILAQLIEQGDEDLLELAHGHLPMIGSGNDPENLMKIITQVCALKRPIFIVFDAEDEMSHTVRPMVVRFLQSLHGSNCRVLVTSRLPPSDDRGVPLMFIGGCNEDIKRYAERRLNDCDVLDGEAGGATASLVAGLVATSNGMSVCHRPASRGWPIYKF